MPSWTDEEWVAEAHAWIRAHVEPVGAIEQPHVRPWSTVLRVPTAGGDVWFKANGPAHVHEAAVVQVLARERPDVVPELVAVDLERGWMLQGDGGERLRELVERERSLVRWLDVLPRYARLQIDVAPFAAELVARGVPDRRLAGLPGQFERFLDVTEGMDEYRRLLPRVREMCAELAAIGVPETIQHDDLHDAQIFVRDGRYLFFDWGDACVSHPFFSMAVTLEGVVSWGVDDVEDSEDVAPHRDAYLGPFEVFAPREELLRALELALRLGWLSRSVSVHAFASTYDPEHRDELLAGVGLRMGLFARGLD